MKDSLDIACDQIWREILSLLPRQRALASLGLAASADDRRELAEVTERLKALRWYSRRYRQVIRDGAWPPPPPITSADSS